MLVAAPIGSARQGPRIFTDPVGDAGTAADVANLWISNDLDGNYLIKTTFATPITRLSNYLVYFDIDKNDKTGSPGGAEYVVGPCQGDLLFERWNGSMWVDNAAGAVEALSPNRKFLALSVRKADIGGARDFDFFVVSRQMDATDDEDDGPAAPAMWHYTYSNRVSIADGGSVEMPARAGHGWTVGVLARRSDSGESLQAGGTISCRASSGGTRLTTAARGFSPVTRDGRRLAFATCEFKVPARLRYRTLHATVSVSYHGSRVTKAFTTTAK